MADESIWKKEISFGRKRKEPVEDAPVEPDVTKDEATSVWKKEISFGRKKQKKEDEQAETTELVAADAPVEEEEEPAWTRAVSFTRKAEPVVAAEPEPAAVEPEPAPEPEPIAVDSGDVPETVPLTSPSETAAEEPAWTTEASFTRAPQPPAVEPEAQPEPVAVDHVDVPSTVPPTSPLETTPEEPAWTTEASFTRTPEPPAVEREPAPEPEPEPVQATVPPTSPEETTVEEPAWTRETSFTRAPEPAVTDFSHVPGTVPESPPVPTSPPESPAVAEPVALEIPAPAPGVHAPVSADELPPLPAEAKVPFWKKDLSFGGGKKEKKPKAERAPKQPKEPKQPKDKKQKEPKAKAPKVPKVKTPRGSRGAKRITGLKIGASQLAAARVANNGSAELLQIARTPLDPGIVVGGELRDPDALAEALKAFFAANNLPKKGVRLGIANNRIGVRTFDIAGISDEKQLANAVRFRAQETLPIPIDEAVLDFKVLGDGIDEHGQPTKRVLLVVAYRELIDRYLDACKKAGISLAGIDLEAFALLRALQPPQDGVGGDSAAALVAVAIGHDRSTFAVSDGRICEFTRVLEWGGAALNVAIARVLDAAPSEVDEVKRALALTDEMVPDGLTADQASQARDAMRRAIQTFARELVSSLQYYQNQPGSLGIGEIVLTGGTAHLAGLSGELERLIGVRVRVGDPLARMKVSKKVGEAEQVGSLAVAIGLGIED